MIFSFSLQKLLVVVSIKIEKEENVFMHSVDNKYYRFGAW